MAKFILTIFLIANNAKADSADNYKEAQQQALEAAYQQSGLKQMVEAYGEKLDRMYVPDYLNKNGGAILVAYKLIHDQQIGYKWTFQ